jgi:hypothetical protein
MKTRRLHSGSTKGEFGSAALFAEKLCFSDGGVILIRGFAAGG